MTSPKIRALSTEAEVEGMRSHVYAKSWKIHGGSDLFERYLLLM